MDKKEALDRASKLLNQVHEFAQEEARSFLTSGKKQFVELSENCLELKEKIKAESGDSDILLVDGESVETKLMHFERDLAKLKGAGRRKIWIIGIAVFLLISVLFWKFGANIQNVLHEIFGVTGTVKYIILGVCGAVVFFVTEGITKKGQKTEDGELTQRNLIVHVVFAVIIPVVLVVIFFSSGGTGGDISNLKALKANIPALLSFAAGYSSKLVVMMLNKIVEKGEQIIKAI